MPIIYRGKDVTAEVKSGTFDTAKAAAEMRACGAIIQPEGYSSDSAQALASEALRRLFDIHPRVDIKTLTIK